MTPLPLLLCMLTAVSTLAISTTPLLVDDLPAPDNDMIDKVKADLPEHCGAAVLAIDQGQVIFRHAYGTADIENQTPVTERVADVLLFRDRLE